MLKRLLSGSDARVRRLRRALAKVIEPTEPDPDPSWDVPIQLSLSGAAALREHIPIDEEGYLFVAGPAWGDSRAYVLYTALDEVKKSAIHLMRQREHLAGPNISPREDRVSRLLFSELVEEQSSRERRLLEVLVSLVLFDTTNEQDYYRHLLLLEHLDDSLSTNLDLEEFYGARSANLDESINHWRDEIRKVETSIDLAKAWYLRVRGSLPKRESLRAGTLLSSVRMRVKAALPIMTDHEKLMFSLSYAGYSNVSESVHYSVSPRDYRLRPGQEFAKARALGLINLAILDRCHKLLGRPNVPVLDKLSSALEKSIAGEVVRRATSHNIEVGDFVLAYGDLAEVLEIKTSSYGYTSYRVRYLAEKPKQEIQEDWFPARYVQRLYATSHWKDYLKLMVSRGDMPPQAGKLSGDQLQAILRKAITESWKLGMRDWVRTRQWRDNGTKE